MTGRRRGPDDPRPLLALLACAAGYALLRLVDRLGPGRLSHLVAGPAALPIALGATVIATALARQRHVATRRTLASRRAFVVVPADEFDAAPELVGSFAAQLARSGRRIGGWWDRRASALRVRLTNDDDGRLVYLLDVAERDLSLLRGALRSFRGVELRDPADVLGGAAAAPVDRQTTLRTELVLARPYVEPLARLPLDPDPLSPFAAALAGLDRGRGERADVCIDLLPIGGFRVLWRRWWMRRQALRRTEAVELPSSGIGGERRGRLDPGEMAERRDLGRGLEVKLRGGATLFEAQVLLAARAPDRSRAEGIMRGLLAAFGPFSDRNWLRASGLHLAGLAFLGSDLPGRRRSFERRLRTGLFRPARRNVVTTAEVAGFLKPPTVNCASDNVLRSGALLAPPPDLPEFDPGRGDLIPIGRVSGEQGERIVGVRAADTFFTYLAGRSRWGKTASATTMFVHLARSGHGGLFLDPHGDALEEIKAYLGEDGVAERVVVVDLGPGGGDDQPCWNLFELRGVDAEDRVEAVVDAFATAMGWGERSTRAINLITQTASALAAISKELPPELAPTVFQIPTLLTDTSWREAILPFLPEGSQSFWRERFPRLSDEAVTPLTNLVDRLGASRRTAALLGASRSTLSLREAMDAGLIVLFCPGGGGTRERLIANLAAFDVFYSARSRGDLDPRDRRLFWLGLDEAQTYDSDTLAAIEEQGAKFGLRAIVMNQNPERLRPATLNSLTTNRSHMMVSALNARAAGLVTKEWAGEPSPEAITRLPRYRFIAQVTDRGEVSRPFALRGVRVGDALGAPPAGGLERLEGAIRCSGRRRRSAEVLAERATLDSRIVGELGSRRRGAARRSAARPRRRGEDCGGAGRPASADSFEVGPS
ncbi:MAG: hypothetical protein JSU06_00500 [Actinobacteria bacterium]|nr:hypothetical protein [Actinomycetota bacterium]